MTRLFVSCFFLCLVSSASAQNTSTDQIEEISVYRNPGKPGAGGSIDLPSNKITIRRAYGQYLLTVLVRTGTDSLVHMKEGFASLSQDEWDSVISVVKIHDLLEFKPVFREEEVYDFGGGGFSILGSRSKIFQYDRPFENADRISPLFKVMGILAAEKIPSIRLYYMPGHE